MRNRCREIFKQMTLLIDFSPLTKERVYSVSIASQYIYLQINMNLFNKSAKPASLGLGPGLRIFKTHSLWFFSRLMFERIKNPAQVRVPL